MTYLNNAARAIQARFKNFRAAKTANHSSPALSGNFDEQVLLEFRSALDKRNLTPDGFFRICDQQQTQTIQTEDFKLQLRQLKLDLTEENIMRLVMLFDEDYNEVITYEDFIDSLDAYGVMRDGD